MIDAYVYSSCSSCRRTEELLNQSGAAFTTRDYFRDGFVVEELATILDKARLDVRDVLSTRSRVFRARANEIDALDDVTLLDLMVEEPTLLRRPLVVGDHGVVIGHNPKQLEELIASEMAVRSNQA